MKHIRIRRREAERGQSLVVTTLLLMGLLGMAAIVVDLGQMWTARRALQAATDASALAGASQLGAGWSSARAAAASEWASNGKPSDSVTYQPATNTVSGDSIVVSASRTMPSIFAQLFGLSSETVSASSQATIETYSTIVSHQNVMPWGVMQRAFQAGATYQIYTDSGSSPDNGALSLPIESACSAASGASDYNNTITGAATACPISVGEVVPTKGGQNAGPTAQAVAQRIGTFQSIQSIVDIDANGNAIVKDSSSPQLVLLPLVINTDGTQLWPKTGSGAVQIVGFAWFVITGIDSGGGSSGGKRVTGVFVDIEQGDMGTSGAWNPGSSASTVALTS